MLRPRDYQEACIKAHFGYFQLRKGNPLFVVPTGGGKSLIIAEFCRRTIEAWPTQRIIILTHVKELIAQNHAAFMKQWGLLAPVGIYSAGLGHRDTDCSVIFAGIQSVWPRVNGPNPAAEKLGDFDLVLIDEAHLCPKRGMGRYRGYLSWLQERNENLKILGYTATPFRLEGGHLHRGEGRIFTDIAYNVPLKKLIMDGYLAPLIAKLPKETIDTEGVGTARGDFKPGELEDAAIQGDSVSCAVAEMVRFARIDDRKHWLVFACGVRHAEQIMSALRYHEIDAELITGETPKDERDDIILRAKAGETTCLVNVGVLTTGFDWPRCDMLALMRPTKSTSLYVQIMGRGMRTFPGKENCLVLDYGENVMRHGPVNDVEVIDAELSDGTGDAPVKACPECQTIVKAGVRFCENCGFEFEFKRDHAPTASTLAPVDFGTKSNPVYDMDVSNVWYDRHQKEGKPDSLKVTYRCGMRIIKEWVCLEHPGFAGRKAQQWWEGRGGLPVPKTVTEALARSSELLMPSKIMVQEDGKYERVVDAQFRKQRGDQPGDDDEGATGVSDQAHGHQDQRAFGRPW